MEVILMLKQTNTVTVTMSQSDFNETLRMSSLDVYFKLLESTRYKIAATVTTTVIKLIKHKTNFTNTELKFGVSSCEFFQSDYTKSFSTLGYCSCWESINSLFAKYLKTDWILTLNVQQSSQLNMATSNFIEAENP